MYKKKSSAVGKECPKLWTKNFVFIILINFLVFMNHIMILSTFPFYIETMGGTAAVAGLAATLFSLVAVLCRPFIGWMLNNGKRKSILVVGIVGMALMPLGYMAVSVLFLAFVARMVHGASLACSNTTSSTIATDIIPKERFAEGMGMFGMSTAFATALAPALGLFLMDKMGYRTLFLSATGAIVIAFILFLMLRVPGISVGKTPLNFKQLVDKDALPASTIVLVFLLTFGALENFTAKFASENGLPSGGIFFTIMACMLFLTRATIGKAADKRGEGIFVYTCNASMFAAFLFLAFIPNTATFLIAAALAGYGFGGIEPALQSMAVHIAPPERRGSANSTFLCAYDIGIGLGGGIAGCLISALGYRQMFVVLSAANIVSLILYVVWGRKHPSSFSYSLPH
ncbi:MFS transporter [Clostridium sp. KNHs216]|uniref:MFS transporter n=1 Tax=Clostridium sp. KNHs216 TaxID=1550235 RepID=UPI00114F3394|nr:MFS transporter [Clostridium sp. KNHs216]TQI68503.1 putative MFS family arabinose efflux permease [Clostridium sp. KNHs216]